MARLTFPNDPLVYGVNNGSLTAAPGTTVTIYTDAAGTILADIQVAGATIVGSVLTVDANSQIPLFLGPDGVDTLYVKPANGSTQAIYARYDDRVDALATQTGVNTTAIAANTTSMNSISYRQFLYNGVL